jgi:hypothetical protein
MQDLCAEGFKMAERRQGLDLSHCLLVMRMLGRFHAASAVLHDRDPDEFSVYDKNNFSSPKIREGAQKFIGGTYPWSHYVRPRGSKYREFLCNRIPNVFSCMDLRHISFHS